jgi:hypothetical protein
MSRPKVKPVIYELYRGEGGYLMKLRGVATNRRGLPRMTLDAVVQLKPGADPDYVLGALLIDPPRGSDDLPDVGPLADVLRARAKRRQTTTEPPRSAGKENDK